MKRWIIKSTGGGTAVLAAMALSGAAPALAATGHHSHKRHHGTATTSTSSTNGNGETALTGSTLTSAENAATAANPGSTANAASTETDSSLSGAAYEVHITKSDGNHAVVIEDSSFNVLATQAGSGQCPGGPGGRPGNGETALTGSTLTSAENAATAANPGSTANAASTETDSSLSGAAYEVHITKSDGNHAVVIEDSSFNVLATQAEQPHRPGPGH